MIFVIVSLSSASCRNDDKRAVVDKDSFKHLCSSDFRLSESKIRRHIADLMFEDKDAQGPALSAKDYYTNNNRFLWISKGRISEDADSVVKYVSRVSDFGFSQSVFRVGIIRSDIDKARSLDFGAANINELYARIEYNLTKAYFKYCAGQRFGYVNPRRLFNRLDVRDSDSVRVSYRELFDLPIALPGKKFFADAVSSVKSGDAGEFLRSSEPRNTLYFKFLEKYKHAGSAQDKMRILCNMERSRWAVADAPDKHEKYVLLNIPSQELDAVDGKHTDRMRVVFGSKETKTPLLQSYIERMDVNPQWIIPQSIVKKSVARNAGNAAYFDAHGYFILQRKTGKHVDPSGVTPDMLTGKDYLVIQRGGRGNAMGRIVFRFKNKFSVFLHDTSNPGLFSASDRMASHGCVRVERPFELAVFLLADKDEDLIKKINYSINADITVNDRDDADAERKPIDGSLIVRSVKVEPKVPLFITYYTLFPDARGNMVCYPDIYGYDKVMMESLRKYM